MWESESARKYYVWVCVHAHTGVFVCMFVCVCMVCMCVCVCVCVCLCVCHMVQWYVQRSPIERLRIWFPTIMVTHVFLLFLRLLLIFFHSPGWLPTASACRSMCCDMCAGKKWKGPKFRHSLARKNHFISVWCWPGWIAAVIFSALPAFEWCNPRTSCYGFCCSIAIIASCDEGQIVKLCVRDYVVFMWAYDNNLVNNIRWRVFCSLHESSRFSSGLEFSFHWLTTAILSTWESQSNRPLGKPARKHHSLLNTQCLGEFTPHQLSLSRLRKIVPEEHHLCSAVQSQTSPGIQTYRDAPFPTRQTPREHQIAAWTSVTLRGAEQALRDVGDSQRCCLQTI